METVSQIEVREAIREFGEALAECDELRAVEDAERALRNDREAMRLLSDYQSAQQSIQMARMWGRMVSKDELDELKILEAKVNSNQIIRNLLDAQKRLQELLVNLNAEISNILGIDFASNSSTGGCC